MGPLLTHEWITHHNIQEKMEKWNHPGVVTWRKEAKEAKLNNKQLLAENKRFLCVFLGWESLASLRLLSVFLRPLKVELFSSSRAPITHCYKRFLSSTSQNLWLSHKTSSFAAVFPLIKPAESHHKLELWSMDQLDHHYCQAVRAC